ncbi:hypothetical protein JCM6882_009498 [Rhodosporidiobolus microsporus]
MPRTRVTSAASSVLSPSSASSDSEQQRFEPRPASRDRARRHQGSSADQQKQRAVDDLTDALEQDPKLAEAMWGVLKKLRRREGEPISDEERGFGDEEEAAGQRRRSRERKGKGRAAQEDWSSSSEGEGDEEHPLMVPRQGTRSADVDEGARRGQQPQRTSRTTLSRGEGDSHRHSALNPAAQLSDPRPSPHQPFSAPGPPSSPPPGLLPRKPRPKININFRFPTSFGSDGLPTFSHNQYLPLRSLASPADEAHHAHQERLVEAQSRYRRRRQSNESSHSSGGILFPLLLTFLLILIPILLLSAVLGSILAATSLSA